MALRPLHVEDAGVLAGWAADPEFCREAGWTVGRPFTELQRFHQRLIESPPPELIRLGAISGGTLVGYVDLHGDEPHRRELGFVIGDRNTWGRGLGSRAAAAGLEHGFDCLGLEEIWAEALRANERSLRILQRLGLAETSKSDDGLLLDQPSHYRRFTITARDWRGRTH